MSKHNASPGWNLARLLQDAILLGLTGASVGMFFSLLGTSQVGLLQANEMDPSARLRLLLAIVLGAALPVTAAAGWLIWKRKAGQAALSRAALIVSPVVVTGPLPALASHNVWFDKPLPFLVALAVLSLWLERLLPAALLAAPKTWRSLRRLPRVSLQVERWLPIALVITAAAAFSGYVWHYSWQQHQRLMTSAFDLGIYDNLLYNASRGQLFRSTVLLGTYGGSYLVGHAEFIMLLFAPMYRLWPGPQFLLALQALMLGAAAIPLYALAARLVSRWVGVVLAICFLLYAPLHGSAFYDFHWLPLSILVNLTLIYSIFARRNLMTGICLVLAILIREDVSVDLFFLGLFLTLSNFRPKLGLFISGLTLCTFVLIRFVVMKLAGTFTLSTLIYGGLIIPGESGFGSIIKTVLTNPLFFLEKLLNEAKLTYALHIFAPLLLLPLRNYRLAILCAGGFFFTFLTTDYAPTVSIRFQYSSHYIPYIFAATVLAMQRLSKRQHGVLRRNSTLFVVAGAIFLHSLVFGAVLQHQSYIGGFYQVSFKISDEERQKYEDLTALIAHIPAEASVAATERLAPHVSSRTTIYTLRSEHGDADYILVDKPSIQSRQRKFLRPLVREDNYKLIGQRGDMYLFGRDVPGQDPSAAWRALGVFVPKGKK